MTSINLEYFFYQTFNFFKESYFFIVNISWPKVFFWSKTIAVIIIILAVAGIIYNLIGIHRARKYHPEEE